MGYFANGTEGMRYEEEYCNHCSHQEGCPIWSLHLAYNGDKKYEDILNVFIPPGEGPYNKQCKMFIPLPEQPKPKCRTPEQEQELLRRWNEREKISEELLK